MEIFAVDAWLFWFLVGVGLLVFEVVVAFTFYAGAVAPAAFAASIVAALDGGIELQLAAFSAGALASLIFLRPIAKRHLEPPDPEHRSNVQSLIGRRAIAISEVDIDSGTVRIGDDVWSARTVEEGTVIAEGGRAEVVDVSGVYAYVKPSPREEETE